MTLKILYLNATKLKSWKMALVLTPPNVSCYIYERLLFALYLLYSNMRTTGLEIEIHWHTKGDDTLCYYSVGCRHRVSKIPQYSLNKGTPVYVRFSLPAFHNRFQVVEHMDVANFEATWSEADGQFSLENPTLLCLIARAVFVTNVPSVFDVIYKQRDCCQNHNRVSRKFATECNAEWAAAIHKALPEIRGSWKHWIRDFAAVETQLMMWPVFTESTSSFRRWKALLNPPITTAAPSTWGKLTTAELLTGLLAVTKVKSVSDSLLNVVLLDMLDQNSKLTTFTKPHPHVTRQLIVMFLRQRDFFNSFDVSVVKELYEGLQLGVLDIDGKKVKCLTECLAPLLEQQGSSIPSIEPQCEALAHFTLPGNQQP